MFIYEKDFFYKAILKSDEELVNETLKYKANAYRKYQIPKSIGMRTIYAIDSNSSLYKLQKNLKSNLLEKFVLPIPAKGFVKKENYITYLSEHINRKYYLRADIKSFFDTITIEQIRQEMSDITSDSDIIDIITNIVTLEGHLPQGAVTSPCISNIIFRRIDQRILKYSQEMGVFYTRYADDMIFSSDNINFNNDTYFYAMIKKILREFGFHLNYNKKKTGTSKIVLSGFVIGRDLHLSRKKLKRLNKILYFFRKSKDYSKKNYKVDKSIFTSESWITDLNNFIDLKNDKFENPSCLVDYLCGYRAFLISFINNADTSERQRAVLINKIKNIEQIVKEISRKYKWFVE